MSVFSQEDIKKVPLLCLLLLLLLPSCVLSKLNFDPTKGCRNNQPRTLPHSFGALNSFINLFLCKRDPFASFQVRTLSSVAFPISLSLSPSQKILLFFLLLIIYGGWILAQEISEFGVAYLDRDAKIFSFFSSLFV